MDVIWKYPLHHGVNHKVIKDGCSVVHFGEQDGNLWMWVQLSRQTNVPERGYRFKVIATGQEFDPWHWKRIATTILQNGEVYHLLEGLRAV